MNWKSWSYWVKGGILGLFASILFTWVNFQNLFGVICSIGKHCPSAWEEFVSGEYIALILYVILPTFLLSCFIGHLYGKVKNRKQII